MQIIFVDDFKGNGSSMFDVVDSISQYCHYIDDEIKIYGNLPSAEDVTYPNVIYVDILYFLEGTSLSMIFPDLKKVGKFYPSFDVYPDYVDLDDFGKIEEIDFFNDMSLFMGSRTSTIVDCEWLGDNMYRFTSDKGSWDIKVNNYD